MQNWMTILIGTLCGCACAYYAERAKKNPYLWFFIGLMCGVLGILFLFFFPFRKKQPAAVPIPPAPTYSNRLWHYLDTANTLFGPMSERKLHEELKQGKISPSTYIWNEEMDNWKTLEELKLF